MLGFQRMGLANMSKHGNVRSFFLTRGHQEAQRITYLECARCEFGIHISCVRTFKAIENDFSTSSGVNDKPRVV